MVAPRLDLNYVEINTVLSAVAIKQEAATNEHWIAFLVVDGAFVPPGTGGDYFANYFGGQLFGTGYFG